MKNTLTSLILVATMALTGCSTVRKIQKERLENILSKQWPTKGENLAQAIKYLAAQEHPTVYQVK